MRNKNSYNWDKLTISNDFIFSKVMKDEYICKLLIEEMLNVKVGKIEYIEEQKTIDLDFSSKGIRLDVYLEDENRIFNIEMQVSNKVNIMKRSRFYQSLIDLNNLQSGEDYDNLKESYIIFICTYDLFKLGLPKYTFQNVCLEDYSLKSDDGAYKVVFNTKAFSKASSENLKAILQYINGEKVQNKFVDVLDSKVNSVKNNEEWRREFMLMKLKEMDIARDNYSKGKLEGMIKQINALKDFNIPYDKIINKIIEDYNVTEDEVKKYL